MVVSCEEVVNANDPQEAPAFILTARDTAVFPRLGDADSIFQTLPAGTVHDGLTQEKEPDPVPVQVTTWLNCKFPCATADVAIIKNNTKVVILMELD